MNLVKCCEIVKWTELFFQTVYSESKLCEKKWNYAKSRSEEKSVKIICNICLHKEIPDCWIFLNGWSNSNFYARKNKYNQWSAKSILIKHLC